MSEAIIDDKVLCNALTGEGWCHAPSVAASRCVEHIAAEVALMRQQATHDAKTIRKLRCELHGLARAVEAEQIARARLLRNAHVAKLLSGIT